MDKVEYKNIYLALVGIAGFVFWVISYFHLFKRPEFRLHFNSAKKRFKIIKSLLFIVALSGWLLICYSLTLPRVPSGFVKNNIEANDIFIVLDVSRSMLAEDFVPNRLEAAKQKIIEFTEFFPKDRISIIIFSEKVFTLLPVTTDLNLIKKVVGEIRTGGILGSGTNIGDALALAVARSELSPAKNKVAVLLSDGVSNVGSVTEEQAAQMAKTANLRVHTIAVGSDDDAKLPVGNSIFGKQYQTIPGGGIDLKALKMIADTTGGKTYRAKDENALKDVLTDIEKLEKAQIEVTGKTIFKELYLRYFQIGLFLLVLVEISKKLILREAM